MDLSKRDRTHPNKVRKQRVLARVIPRIEAVGAPPWAVERLRSQACHFSSDDLEAIEAVLDAMETQYGRDRSSP